MPENQPPSVDASSATALDHFWQEMGYLTQPGDIQQKHFPHLSHLCKVLLVLPHTTADPEHLFSMVRKIETDHRGSLLPSTLASLLKPGSQYDAGASVTSRASRASICELSSVGDVGERWLTLE